MKMLWGEFAKKSEVQAILGIILAMPICRSM